jgi:HD-GYP domain-containing protein (c-di-GMP phosphodiesterase class II)
MKTHLRTRAFILCFLPFAILLASSFWMIQRFVQLTVRDGLHTSLRESQVAIANIHAKGDLQNSRFLRVAGENTALKAGMELLTANPQSGDARSTVEDQLRELGEHMGFDFMLVTAPSGKPLAGVARQGSPKAHGGQLVPIDTKHLDGSRSGFLLLDERIFQVASVPIDVNDENIGGLTVGEFFDFSDITTQVVLIHDGAVVESNLPNVSSRDLESALGGCRLPSECDLRLNGTNWISLPMDTYGNGYTLLSLENVDLATRPIQARLHSLFLELAAASVLIAFLCSIGSSSSIVNPIAAVVLHLRNAVRTGKLREIESEASSIVEIQELADIYNQAAVSVRSAGERLESAYLQFVGSLASALDARDQYTAGHSRRVSDLSCSVASALQLPAQDIERIRIGALLHDIGKIGVSDSILQKPGRLSADEFAQVKQHPVIGRRILEGVHGFADYLSAVELHHENWDGTGYPRGQKRDETPIDARVIHVADAYDAMTTDRSYRRGMTHEKAISELVKNAGRQFDPEIVDAFVKLPNEVFAGERQADSEPNEAETLEEVEIG